MSPGEVVLALLRRWYVLAVALVLTACGAYAVLRPAQTWLSSAVVVVKPPVTGNQPNQLANLQPPLAAVSYAVVQQLRAPSGARELADAGVHGGYALLPRNSGTSVTPQYLIPSVQIQVRAGDGAAADSAVRAITTVYRRHLEALQDAQRVPAGSRMSLDLLVPPSAVLETGARTRALGGVALTGLIGGVLAALWTDRRLRRDRGARPAPAPAPA
ncbi:hypothetical protein VSR01_37300 [Actinacidiphila sp. DG2A-62]|uniref:hypothetical protein n=1 Tax=Actinacidiphila sp. DG2A-62 TaxID=3108821 RepID=UPI002DB63313|nr:hypothetical protein [Actinacidiphila sp. DG2A-62]MEC3998839.1 hypothetical protein [Actinacidiphila sp. DG2A-62]